ncbi:diguanylate cyclase [Sporolactobacillus sp. THM7-7]|nr:diguanylate cyclase [Sporolactobacillus sp. THM7-7]
MRVMDSILSSVLNNINEGIVIVTSDLKIIHWNPFMEKLTGGKKKEEVIGLTVGKVLPELDKNYFYQAAKQIITDGRPVFFSAAMHRYMVSKHYRVNLNMNRVTGDGQAAILLEFIDVTGQFLRISQLRNYVRQLSLLNKRLKQKEKVIKKLAYYDNLTGVANRALFDKLAEKYLTLAKQSGTMLGLMFVDVNEFKGINDTYGHHVGDQVMTRVASFLTESTRKNDIVCRYGGDEFLVLLPDIQTFEDFQIVSDRLLSDRQSFLIYDGCQVGLSLSIGTSLFPKDGQTIHELIARADSVMYANKKAFRKGKVQ